MNKTHMFDDKDIILDWVLHGCKHYKEDNIDNSEIKRYYCDLFAYECEYRYCVKECKYREKERWR